jgi:predicted nucleotidyltransferase
MTQSSFRLIIQTLNNAQVRYLVVGGIAVNAHGFPRFTRDVDLLIHLEETNLLTALRALATLGYKPHIPVTFEEFANPRNRETWIAEKQMKVLKLFSDAHPETFIDVFVYDPLGFDEAYRHAHYHPLPDNINVPVCSYEDLVKLKRLAGRPQDLVDIEELRVARGEP